VPIGGGAGGHDDGLGDDPVIDAGLAVGRVQEHIPERLPGQRPVAERRHLGVQLGADPADLTLGDAAVRAEGLDQVIDLAGGGAVQVGLHDDRKQ
jgi:hypothetical protein